MRKKANIVSHTFSPNSQRGFSLISLVFWIGLLSLVLTCGLKMGPVYQENWTLQSILKALPEEFAEQSEVDKNLILDKISRRMRIDMIKSIKSREIAIERQNNVFLVSANYEVRVPIMGNVDVVMKFDDQVEVPVK